MRSTFFLLLCTFWAISCQLDNNKPGNIPDSGLSLVTEPNPEWQYESLRLYPVTANGRLLAEHNSLSQIKTLAEGMNTHGFRIMEKKQFGASEEWRHVLTVQNKSQDTVLLMSGDVVQGGNQDRAIAHHQVIMPHTVTNIEVYCVEKGRSSYYDQSAPEAEKQAAAFKGFYNVASPQVRHAIQNTGGQGEVWNAVARVTEQNQVSSTTGSYLALDQPGEQTSRREACLNFFKGKFQDADNIVGVVAVSGDKILGVDIFGHPRIFRQHFAALMHGYAAEGLDKTSSKATMSQQEVQKKFEEIALLADKNAKTSSVGGKFSFQDNWVHLFSK